MLAPVLSSRGLPAQGQTTTLVLDQLRALSGRIALKLISAPTQRAEVFGLALSRLFLASQGVFANQVVVPLDAHLDLFAAVFRDAAGGQEITLKRTDLALFDLDAANRVITCHLVEVKCYSSAGDQAAYENLCSSIADQLAMSERALQWHFDPQRQTEDRADRPMKSRELAALLGYYLDRSIRHGLITQESAAESAFFLDSIEQGYQIQFTRTGLVFDFSRADGVETRSDLGVEYHRVGRDIVAALLQPTGEKPDEGQSEGSIEKLTTAQFIAPERDRTGTLARIARLKRRPTIPAVTPDEQTSDAPDMPPSVPATPNVDADAGQEPPAPPTPPVATSAPDPSPEPVKVPPPTIEPSAPPSVRAEVTLGVTDDSLQFGVLGDYGGKNVVLDLNHTHTISLFGVQGGGKSYTLGSIIEMATMPIPGICHLPQPLATIVFHYSKTQDYQPEFASMRCANDEARQMATLRERFGAEAKSLDDVVLLAPPGKIADRQDEFPGITVLPLVFSAGELQAAHWRFLMGAVGNQSLYLKQINQLMRQCRQDLSLSGLRSAIQASAMSDSLKATASSRLDVAGQYIDDAAQRFTDLIRPGRLVIVDLRDEFIDKDEALGLFVVMLQLVSEAKIPGQAFNKLVVFDEAHKYIESPDLVAGLIEVVREMRHKGTSILVASQDPPSVPVSLIELSSCIIMHRFNSPQWLKHIQRANAALNGLTPEAMAALGPGEAMVWSGKASDQRFSRGAIKVHCRPRVTKHGGATKTAVDG